MIFHNTGSDDDEEEEGSTAAMDGSALRTPPADAEPIEPGSGGGSESGKSDFPPLQNLSFSQICISHSCSIFPKTKLNDQKFSLSLLYIQRSW